MDFRGFSLILLFAVLLAGCSGKDPVQPAGGGADVAPDLEWTVTTYGNYHRAVAGGSANAVYSVAPGDQLYHFNGAAWSTTKAAGTLEDFLDVFYARLVPDTAEHKSSTLQDIVAKKPTEIDALNGAVIRLAANYELDVPHNSVVYNIIKFIEAKSR